MRHTLILLFVWLSVTTSAYSQAKSNKRLSNLSNDATYIPEPYNQHIDSLCNYLMNNYKSDELRVKAAYQWIVSSISYDTEKALNIEFINNSDKYNINDILKARKGVCADYAKLFQSICIRIGIKSYVVTGYTKQNDQIDFIPHAWCVFLLDSVWQLADPTWDAGYVVGNSFKSIPSLTYYRIKPTDMVKTHMPFDPVWQLLERPVSYYFFDTSRPVPQLSNRVLNYNKLISDFIEADSARSLILEIDRVSQEKTTNSIVQHHLQILRFNLVQLNAAILGKASIQYNFAVDKYNQFISFLNKQFKPAISDSELRLMLQDPKNLCVEVRRSLTSVQRPTSEIISSQNQLISALDKLEADIDRYNTWLSAYLTKGKIGRALWFSRLSQD